MVEFSGGPIKKETIGGVKYNANQFYALDLGDGKFQLESKKTGEIMIFPQQSETLPARIEYTRDGQTVSPEKNMNGTLVKDMTPEQLNYYSIEIKEVKDPRNAEVKLDIDDGMIWDDAYYEISQVDGLSFESSKESVSDVTLKDCTNSTVDLSANNSRHYSDRATIEGGHGNEVIMDKKDYAEIDGQYVDGEGTAAQDDYVE